MNEADEPDVRRRFALQSGIYLLSHSVGLMPCDTPERVMHDLLEKIWGPAR